MDKVNVLVVVDAQNDFATGSLGTRAAEASIPYIADKIKALGEEGAIMVATKDTHGDDYMETSEGRSLPVLHTVAKTPGWNLVYEVRTALDQFGCVDVLKGTFGSPDLASTIRVLAQQRLRKVITDGKELAITLVGWCTDICVISNAILLKVAFPEANICVDAKCCAGVTPELHDAALRVMQSCQITVV